MIISKYQSSSPQHGHLHRVSRIKLPPNSRNSRHPKPMMVIRNLISISPLIPINNPPTQFKKQRRLPQNRIPLFPVIPINGRLPKRIPKKRNSCQPPIVELAFRPDQVNIPVRLGITPVISIRTQNQFPMRRGISFALNPVPPSIRQRNKTEKTGHRQQPASRKTHKPGGPAELWK